MGVSFDDYMRWRTPTSQTSFIDNLGNIGSHTPMTSASYQAHKELISMTKAISSVGGSTSDYLQAVKGWATKRLPNGQLGLPF